MYKQMSIFDFITQGVKEKQEPPEEPLMPLLNKIECDHHSRYLCNRWHGGDEYIKKCKNNLVKEFACSGCCYYCSQSPQHGGKCKFECRREKR